MPETDVHKTAMRKTAMPETVPETAAPKTDMPKTEVPQTEVPQTQKKRQNKEKVSGQKTDAPQSDVPQTDVALTDVAQTERRHKKKKKRNNKKKKSGQETEREYRSYGFYKCDSCRKSWQSAHTYTRRIIMEDRVRYEPLYGQQCKSCYTMTKAYRVEEIVCSLCGERVSNCDCRRRMERRNDTKKPHLSELCERCQSGKPCTGYNTYDDNERLESCTESDQEAATAK